MDALKLIAEEKACYIFDSCRYPQGKRLVINRRVIINYYDNNQAIRSAVFYRLIIPNNILFDPVFQVKDYDHNIINLDVLDIENLHVLA